MYHKIFGPRYLPPVIANDDAGSMAHLCALAAHTRNRIRDVEIDGFTDQINVMVQDPNGRWRLLAVYMA